MPSLLDLPSELLQRVAQQLPCSAALSFIRVNRRLYEVCKDHIVFKYIAMHSREISNRATSWPEGTRVLENASLQETIRIAFAVERAQQRATEETPQWFTYDLDGVVLVHRDVEEWLPHMLALHHPMTEFFKVEDLLLMHLELAQGRHIKRPPDRSLAFGQYATLLNVAFCVTYLALERLSKMSHEGCQSRAYDLFVDDPADHLSEYFKVRSPTWGLTAPEPETELWRSYDHAQASASVLPLLQCILGGGYFDTIKFPRPARIPFDSLMEIPPIYRSTGPEFSYCHAAKMTKPEFLSGRWQGFYTDQREPRSRQLALVNGPMRDINVIARNREAADRPSATITAMIDRHTRGVDSHGTFLLYGEVHENMTVDLIKIYLEQGWEWMWHGFVMPFGIIGHWSDLSQNFGGYFWIWKEEWCA